jgi:hypothetical protein
LETLAKDAANERAELRDRNKALENEINVIKTKLSFEQQESKFKQDRLQRQLKETDLKFT